MIIQPETRRGLSWRFTGGPGYDGRSHEGIRQHPMAVKVALWPPSQAQSPWEGFGLFTTIDGQNTPVKLRAEKGKYNKRSKGRRFGASVNTKVRAADERETEWLNPGTASRSERHPWIDSWRRGMCAGQRSNRLCELVVSNCSALSASAAPPNARVHECVTPWMQLTPGIPVAYPAVER